MAEEISDNFLNKKEDEYAEDINNTGEGTKNKKNKKKKKSTSQPVNLSALFQEYLAQSNFSKVVVQQTTNKGRILVATKDLVPGEIVFTEEALVSVKDDNLEELIKKIVGLFHLKSSLAGSGTNNSISNNNNSKLKYAECLLELYSNENSTLYPEFFSVARRILASIPQERIASFQKYAVSLPIPPTNRSGSEEQPPSLAERQIAHVIGIISTNTHSENDSDGRGAYLCASMIEHSCIPNCNYVANGAKLSCIALANIKKGQALSISYCNDYQPTQQRQEYLMHVYGFTCQCPRCTTEPDLCRAFRCTACNNNNNNHSNNKKGNNNNNNNKPTATASDYSIMCPRGRGEKPEDWRCTTCSHQLKSEAEMKRITDLEDKLKEIPAEELDIQAALQEGTVHESHYLIYRAMHVTAREMQSRLLQSGGGHGASARAKMAERLYERAAKSAERVLIEYHPEKAVLYAALGRIRASPLINDKKGAKEALARACDIVRVANGQDSPQTQRLITELERL